MLFFINTALIYRPLYQEKLRSGKIPASKAKQAPQRQRHYCRFSLVILRFITVQIAKDNVFDFTICVALLANSIHASSRGRRSKGTAALLCRAV
jgi:hypothetical protein